MKVSNILVTTIKDLLKKGEKEEKCLKICEKIYKMTEFINDDYPERKNWFYKKQLPQTLDVNSNRDIIFAFNKKSQEIYGSAFIKNSQKEKKICTLFVREDKRRLGIGTKLIEKSIEKLGTNKPMITFADYKLSMFKSLIKKYDWEQKQVLKNLYNNHSTELVFNKKKKKDD